jgi:catechol 2,3-dioxygenase-like lactoylglutathione lyase family enzyme
MTAFPPVVHFAVTVSDIDRSIAWYEALFGAPPFFAGDEATYRFAIWLEPMFALHEHHGGGDGASFDERRIGLDHIAFGCSNRDELDAWLVRLDELGIDHGRIVEAFYGTGLAFRDLDNIQLEFFVNPS